MIRYDRAADRRSCGREVLEEDDERLSADVLERAEKQCLHDHLDPGDRREADLPADGLAAGEDAVEQIGISLDHIGKAVTVLVLFEPVDDVAVVVDEREELRGVDAGVPHCEAYGEVQIARCVHDSERSKPVKLADVGAER